MRDQAIMLCDDILDLILDLPEKCEEMADDIYNKTVSIKEWVLANNHATEKQVAALESMKSGCEKWLNN